MSETNLMDTYLDELRATLRVGEQRRERILEEVRAHLEDAQDRGRKDGLSPATAVQRAIAEFGAARDVAARFSVELNDPVTSPQRFRHLGIALGAQAAALLALPFLFRLTSNSVAKCVAAVMFVSVGLLFLGDVLRLRLRALRRPVAWMLLPYLAVALPFFVATFAYRSANGMNFVVLGIEARAIHLVLETLFMLLAGATVFELVQLKRSTQPAA